MSIEQRETDEYAERRRRENAEMAQALSAAGAVVEEQERRYLIRRVQDAASVVSTVTLRKVARDMGVLPPRYDTSEDAGRPWHTGCGPDCSMCNPDATRPIPGAWPGEDSGAEGEL